MQHKRKKELGNASYKNRDFEIAIYLYTRAMDSDDKDISYLTNKATVYLEMGRSNKCIKG
jgi:stress-induced-phosphoprotein 1